MPDGSVHWLLGKKSSPPLGYAWCGIGAHPWPSKQSAKLVHLFILFILTLAAAGEIVTTCPMATFRDICTFVRIVDLLLALKC